MTHRVFGDAFYIVVPLGRVHVADELGVQVHRMVRSTQRNLKVVQCEDVFQQFRIVSIPDPAGLP